MKLGPMLRDAAQRRSGHGEVMRQVGGTSTHGSGVTGLQVVRAAVAVLIPPIALLAAIHSKLLGRTVLQRPGLLALTILTFALALSFQRLRRLLVVVLGYGATVLAIHGAVHAWRAGAPRELGPLRAFYLAGWLGVFLLSFSAGTLEVFRPGTVLAKRLLFAAGGLLLTGYGVVGVLVLPNVFSATALVAGVCSAMAALLAHRLTVQANPPAVAELETAEALARRRSERLRLREWRDPAEKR